MVYTSHLALEVFFENMYWEAVTYMLDARERDYAHSRGLHRAIKMDDQRRAECRFARAGLSAYSTPCIKMNTVSSSWRPE